MEKGPQHIKNAQNSWKRLSRKRKHENEPESLHLNEKERKKLSRHKQLKENPQKVKNDQNRWQESSRLIDSEKKRLRKFKRSTMFNAIFTCLCCQRNLFECNVSQFTTQLLAEIETKKPGIYEKAIEMVNSTPITVNVNGSEESYICIACKKHLKAGKLPPMSAKNGLKIYNHTADMELTELEGNLIAKNIVFMKIFQLPKTRWTALKDRIVNVPVHNDDILNTMMRLPRTPDEAGLIEVDLKRKVEYKNSHIQQLIDPKKCFKMLELLKKKGNIHYQFYDDYNIYTERCRDEDSRGYTVIFDEETEVMHDISKSNKKRKGKNANSEEEEISIEEILENEYLKKDPVRRYQFKEYNKSICMSNMYPEVAPENSVIVAPGEGKAPKNVLYDHDWDIKAFPHLNSPDGKYGLHHSRITRLSNQFISFREFATKIPNLQTALLMYMLLLHIQN